MTEELKKEAKAPKEVKQEPKPVEKPAIEKSEPKKEQKPDTSAISKSENVKIFTIPLRKVIRKRGNGKTNYAVSLIIDFIKRNTKAENVKLGKHLNERIWKNLPRRIRIKTVKEDNTIKAELFGFEYKDFKAMPKTEKAEGMKEKLLGRMGPKALKKEKEEKMIEEKKKPETAQKIEKEKMLEE